MNIDTDKDISSKFMSHILYIIRDIRRPAARSSLASGTRSAHLLWEPAGSCIPRTLCAYPQSPFGTPYRNGTPDWKGYNEASAKPLSVT